jgi:hypothetical protein
MKNIASISDIKSLIVDVSEEITQKNLLNFAHTSLSLNNIEYFSSDVIYWNYLEYSKQYQFFVFDDSFKYMIIELLNFENEQRDELNDLSTFRLYITKTFFVIYKNSKLYSYQIINQLYTKDELLNYISKNFNISISEVKELTDIEFENIKDNIVLKERNSSFFNINKKNKKSFHFYVLYLLFCLFSTIFYDNYKNKILNNERLKQISDTKKEYFKISKLLKFKPFNIEYKKLINATIKFNLRIISFTYNIGSINIKVSTKKKSNIYLFLNDNKRILLGSSIVKLDAKNIFVSTINVKTN